MRAKPIDPRLFRTVLGQFATGVTIVTTLDQTDKPIGLTANSFNSASLDPPMVLWCLARSSANLQSFVDAGYFAVNVLSEDQAELSNRFASPVEERFLGLDCEQGVGGVPLLPGCAARFQCKTVYRYEGGDHLIFVGEVLDFDNYERPPLLFHQGRYAVAEACETEGDEQRQGEKGGYVDDFLLPLLSRAFRLLSAPFYAQVESAGLNRDEWRVLATLADRKLTVEGLARIIVTDVDTLQATVNKMKKAGMVRLEITGDGAPVAACTAAGSARIIRLLAIAKAREADATTRFAPHERQTLKRALQRLVSRSPGEDR